MATKAKEFDEKLIESDIKKLTSDIIKVFPKYFDNFTGFEYGDGRDAGKDFKKIFDRAKKIQDENRQG